MENQDNQDISELLKVMERRLYYAITWPAMVFTILMGITMFALNPMLLKMGWIHMKLLMVVALLGYHFYSGHIRKEFAENNFKLTSKQCRMINEVPTIILLIIVPLAIIKPLLFS